MDNALPADAGPGLCPVLIADDHILVREAIGGYLEGLGGYDVAYADSMDAIREALLGRPEGLILLDVSMPGVNGIESIRALCAEFPAVQVVIFSGMTSADFARRAIDCGARGFIPKTMRLRALSMALQLIRDGQSFIPANIAAAANRRTVVDEDNFPARELEILRLVALGKSNKEIGWMLGLAEITVKMHMRTLSRKLDASNRTDAAIKAKALGLI